MKRIVTALVIVAALAVPAVASAGTATKQVKRKQVAKRALASVGIPELPGWQAPKAGPKAPATRSYRLVKMGSGACEGETYTLVVDGRASIPMC
jgi:hypothetical protein